MILLALLAPAFAAPPLPSSDEPAAVLYEYRGPDETGTWSADEIVALVRLHPTATHEVRGPGVPDWTPWTQAAPIAAAWLGPGAERTWQYAEGDAAIPLRTAAVVDRIHAAPDQAHLVWRPGMTDWADARTLPSFRGPLTEEARPAEPAPEPVTPVAPPKKPVEPKPIVEALGLARPAVHVGGDIRFDLVAADLQALGQDGQDAPAAGFRVSRVRPILDVDLGTVFSSRVAIEVGQDDSSTTYGDAGLEVDVTDWARGWYLTGREVWLQAEGGDKAHHRLRIGLQEPAFGSRDTYEEEFPFAGESRADFGRAEGYIPEEDLGVGWRGEFGSMWAIDLQALNGAGGEAFDDNDGKDFIARITASPGTFARIGVSGLFGSRREDSTGQQAQGALTIDLHGPHQRLLLEGLAGSTTEDRIETVYSGFRASGAWSIPANSTVLSSLDVLARFSFADPVWGMDAPDAHWGPAAGLWLAWKVGEEQDVRTGATWEMYVPQDAAIDVEHDVVVEAAWRF